MSEKVCAVVVTYNRKELLRECVRALLAQTRPVDTVLVVDNASTDGTLRLLEEEFPEPSVEALALPGNVGGAGGFHEGMRHAHERGFDWVWLMDDDAIALPDALEELLKCSGRGDVLVPLQRDKRGRLYGASVWSGRQVFLPAADIQAPREIDMFAFVGPLVSRRTIDVVGLPVKEFFIYFDDWQYSLRIKKAGLSILLVPKSIFDHDYGAKKVERRLFGRPSVRSSQPAWKTYYDTRNYLRTVIEYSPSLESYAWFSALQVRRLLGDIVYEPDRWTRLGLRWRGVIDGLAGRLGKRVDPGRAAPGRGARPASKLPTDAR